jgi:ferredoxin-type protein NapH
MDWFLKKRGKWNIPAIRKISQVFFFILILYGAIIATRYVFPRYGIDATYNSDNFVAKANSAEQELILFPNFYGPSKTCKFVGREYRSIRGCPTYFLSETLTYQTTLKYLGLLFSLVLLMFLFGKAFCGWFCPVGFLSDMLDETRKWFGISYLKLPRAVASALVKTRYILLSIIVLIGLAIGLPFLSNHLIRKELFQMSCQFCPAKIIFGLVPGGWNLYLDHSTLVFGLLSGISVLAFIIFLSGFFIRRAWCRICPNGAILSLFNPGSLLVKEKDLQKCTKCGICYNVCPYDNEDVFMVKDRKNVNGINCMNCLECVDKCPENDCLTVKFCGKKIVSSRFRKTK